MQPFDELIEPDPQAGNPFAASQVAPYEVPVEREPYRSARVAVLLVGVSIVAVIVGFVAVLIVGAFVEGDAFDRHGMTIRLVAGGAIGLAAGGMLYAICKEEL